MSAHSSGVKSSTSLHPAARAAPVPIRRAVVMMFERMFCLSFSETQDQRRREDVVAKLADAAVLLVEEVLGLEHDVRVEDDAQAAREAPLLRDVDAVRAQRHDGVALLGARQKAQERER